MTDPRSLDAPPREAAPTPRPDPRIALGMTVEPQVRPPFSVRGASPASPDDGGTLDCGLLGHVADGRPVVFGEIWAACPSGTHEKVRLDARAVAERIVSLLNATDPEALARLTAALKLAATRLEILTDRMRGCNAVTGMHELLSEAEAFCAEARAALAGTP